MARRTGRTGKPTALPSSSLEAAAKTLTEVEDLRLARKFEKARVLCARLLGQHPNYFGALHTMGLILADMRDYERSLTFLVKASIYNPESWTTLTALAGVYLRLEAAELAAWTLEQAIRLQPHDATTLVTLGEIYRDQREYEAGAQSFRDALAIEPDLIAANQGLGLCCSELGAYAEAARAYERAISAGSRSISVVNGLSQIPAQFVKLDILSAIDKSEQSAAETEEEFSEACLFTRAAVLHDTGEHKAAWKTLCEANAGLRTRFRPEHEAQMREQAPYLSGSKGAAIRIDKARFELETPVSLFILGTSRSGKTTAEQIIGSQPGVKRGYENPLVERSVARAFQLAGLPTRIQPVQVLPTMSNLWKSQYLSLLQKRTEDANVFTNTHPGQIHNALRLAKDLPNVRFILIKRDPDDVTLRIYMKKYREGNAYAYDLATIREHISWYNQMIDVVAAKLPALARIVTYEEFVARPLHLAETAAELCGFDVEAGAIPSIGDDRGCSSFYPELKRRCSG